MEATKVRLGTLPGRLNTGWAEFGWSLVAMRRWPEVPLIRDQICWFRPRGRMLRISIWRSFAASNDTRWLFRISSSYPTKCTLVGKIYSRCLHGHQEWERKRTVRVNSLTSLPSISVGSLIILYWPFLISTLQPHYNIVVFSTNSVIIKFWICWSQLLEHLACWIEGFVSWPRDFGETLEDVLVQCWFFWSSWQSNF